ncbi:AbrB/MazE/SpoVT family DNA-binding domain-containing protein [Thermococcus sp.]|uniref:AbrB/MazE/SpoVT family DNA-binding domain-containing protein n=1 Tax=Thermococcus sp. TaxID=35749 RepID=UPI0026055887|nr:AbrB/MazE/SpoVT family DNA-binding domain-containing protein [Thermococcus sp.]
MPDSEPKIIEPLAKFHVRVLSKNRITFPKETRDFYRISEFDYVLIILRIREAPEVAPKGRVLLVLRIGTNGVASIPKDIISKFNIQKGDILEIILLKVIHSPKIKINEGGLSITIPSEFKKRGYTVLDERTETQLLQEISYRF